MPLSAGKIKPRKVVNQGCKGAFVTRAPRASADLVRSEGEFCLFGAWWWDRVRQCLGWLDGYRSADRSPTEDFPVGFHSSGLIVPPCLTNTLQVFGGRGGKKVFQKELSLLLHLLDRPDHRDRGHFHLRCCALDSISPLAQNKAAVAGWPSDLKSWCRSRDLNPDTRKGARP